MPKKADSSRVTNVTARLPNSVELTKRNSQNSLKVDIKSGRTPLETLYIGSGSVEWWPGGNRVNAHRADWVQLAKIFEEQLPRKRSAKPNSN